MFHLLWTLCVTYLFHLLISSHFSVAYVSRSGGLSNELNNIIGANSDGVFEGIAIGGDRYPGSTYTEHIMRYQKDDRYRVFL